MTLRPGMSAATSATTRAMFLPTVAHASCCAWQPIALITSASPLRFGSSTQPRRLFFGPSSTRVAMPAWMYSTCTIRIAPSVPSCTSVRA